jgi:hypothetical protein
MKRRALLTSLGAGIVGTAGCLTGNSNSGGSTPQQSVGSPVAVSTPSGKKADFRLTNFDGGDTAEIGQEYTFTVTVQNNGDQPGVYEANADVRKSISANWETQQTVRIFVEGGESKTVTVTLPPFEGTGTVEFRFDNRVSDDPITVVGPDLPMGTPFNVDSFDISVDSVEFRQEIDYGNIVQSADDGEKFAVATVTLANAVDRLRTMPQANNFRLNYNERTVPPFTTVDYNQVNVPSGGQRGAELPYRIDESATTDELVFQYTGQRQDDRRAYWSTRFGTSTSAGGSSGGSASGSGSPSDGSTPSS